MSLTPYIHFNGQCEAAFRFYAGLGGELKTLMTYGDAPEGCPVTPESRHQVMHAHLELGGGTLMGCDAPHPVVQPPSGFSVAWEVKDPKEAERIFAALAEGGQVNLPLQATFFSQRFGMVADRFGIAWMVNCPKPDFTPGAAH